MSIYIPKHFQEKNLAPVSRLILENPFATLISIDDDGELVVSHLPLLCNKEVTKITGHMARANPHWQYIQKNPKIKIIFHGPHTYITPKWYVSGRDVPTWNYMVAHVSGKARLIESEEGLIDILKETTDVFEKNDAKPWKFELPPDLKSAGLLPRAIVGFEISVTQIESKFKLNQNRSLADQEAVSTGLSQRKDEMSLKVRAWMNEIRTSPH